MSKSDCSWYLSWFYKYLKVFLFVMLQWFSSVEQLPVKSKSSKGRKTWDQSTPVKKREPHLHNTSTSYKRSEMMRDVLGNESVSSSHPYTTMDTYSSLATPSSCVRKQDFISCETQSYASAPNGSSLGRKQDLLSNETQTFISASTSSSLGKKPDFSSSGSVMIMLIIFTNHSM